MTQGKLLSGKRKPAGESPDNKYKRSCLNGHALDSQLTFVSPTAFNGKTYAATDVTPSRNCFAKLLRISGRFKSCL